ncbi:MAG: pyruvate kinase, partial [Acidobacteria bacterium]
MHRTKIVATLGPASETRETITRLIDAGMDVARINFSHGTYEDHAERIAMVREAATAAGRAVAVLQDLQGPKIRTGLLAGGRPVQLVAGATFSITTEEVIGDAARVSTTYEALPRDIRPGDRILLSDGAISLRVIRASETEVTTEVVDGGSLSERQGINLPGIDISIRGVTDKDLADLSFGLRQEVDHVAISFVRTADDVRLVKQHIAEAGSDTPVIAKIEKPEAIDVLEEIIDAADGVMVARGDLAVELAPEK